jgi:hypothetical protein
MKKRRTNDEERRLWVLNDEGLYNLWRRSCEKNMMKWIRANRALIDGPVEAMTTGKKPQHYLAYGG